MHRGECQVEELCVVNSISSWKSLHRPFAWIRIAHPPEKGSRGCEPWTLPRRLATRHSSKEDGLRRMLTTPQLWKLTPPCNPALWCNAFATGRLHSSLPSSHRRSHTCQRVTPLWDLCFKTCICQSMVARQLRRKQGRCLDYMPYSTRSFLAALFAFNIAEMSNRIHTYLLPISQFIQYMGVFLTVGLACNEAVEPDCLVSIAQIPQLHKVTRARKNLVRWSPPVGQQQPLKWAVMLMHWLTLRRRLSLTQTMLKPTWGEPQLIVPLKIMSRLWETMRRYFFCPEASAASQWTSPADWMKHLRDKGKKA